MWVWICSGARTLIFHVSLCVCVHSNESVLPACQEPGLLQKHQVWESGIRSASVVGAVFLGRDALCDAWSHHESMSCWPFPGSHRHPGPAAAAWMVLCFPGRARCALPWALWSPASRPAHPCRTPWHTLGWGHSQSLISLLPLRLAHGPHGAHHGQRTLAAAAAGE